jgi:hypothetical protein
MDREERAVRGSSEASEFSASVGIQRARDLAPAWSESTERIKHLAIGVRQRTSAYSDLVTPELSVSMILTGKRTMVRTLPTPFRVVK